jgi:hypothetical protein
MLLNMLSILVNAAIKATALGHHDRLVHHVNEHIASLLDSDGISWIMSCQLSQFAFNTFEKQLTTPPIYTPSVLPGESNPVPLPARIRHEVLRLTGILRIRHQPERSPVTCRCNDGLDEGEIEDTSASFAGEG